MESSDEDVIQSQAYERVLGTVDQVAAILQLLPDMHAQLHAWACKVHAYLCMAGYMFWFVVLSSSGIDAKTTWHR